MGKAINNLLAYSVYSGNNLFFMEFITKNFEETQQLAGRLLDQITILPHSGALVLALKGELGAGKTTFIQGLGKTLGIKDKILSPTFVIMKRFETGNKRFDNLYHLDCYRLRDERDLVELGFEEILKNKNNLVVIEWPERIKKVLPADTMWLEFEHGGEDIRKIKM
jgi:tRNA threonylcarbamoyladenosine biosynthesis protein TsaE